MLVFHSNVLETPVVNAGTWDLSLLSMKMEPASAGDGEGQIPAVRKSVMYFSFA